MSASINNRRRIAVATLLAAFFFAVFASLGIWQIYRLQWKLDLIARVDARVTAPAVPAPGKAEWAGITSEKDSYRHVTVHGTFLNDDEVQVYYSTSLGPGYFVMTPLKRDDGTIVMINRGYVPEEKRDPSTREPVSGETTVTGLLRMSEDHGWLFSQDNKPDQGRWYRRDVGAIASAKGLSDVAPYFIDADNTPNPGTYPIGGLTVVSFRNAHLSYIITWFGMALGTLIVYGVVLRQFGVWGKPIRDPEDED
ncbi:SURF1 family protein [Martelella alba]|uniref:SURF1-like protein n=1 Tax=Martelella alba TaxID=2590451 RepID=A0A506U7F8_9HYPH|nr:SURF1 family protein [Martelella alba]TPW28549.1 SURF1 family protein [Martelella alba]